MDARDKPGHDVSCDRISVRPRLLGSPPHPLHDKIQHRGHGKPHTGRQCVDDKVFEPRMPSRHQSCRISSSRSGNGGRRPPPSRFRHRRDRRPVRPAQRRGHARHPDRDGSAAGSRGGPSVAKVTAAARSQAMIRRMSGHRAPDSTISLPSRNPLTRTCGTYSLPHAEAVHEAFRGSARDRGRVAPTPGLSSIRSAISVGTVADRRLIDQPFEIFLVGGPRAVRRDRSPCAMATMIGRLRRRASAARR